MRRKGSLAHLFVLTLVLLVASGIPTSSFAAGGASQDDAGSGGDAGDTQGNALPIANVDQSFSGNLSPVATDVDWYGHGASDASCSVAQVTPTLDASVALAEGPQAAELARTAPAGVPTVLALAAPAGQVPLLGVQAAGAAIADSASYDFAFRSRTVADLDPTGQGESPPAGATAATAAPLPGPCFVGALQGDLGNTRDEYYFDVTQPGDLTISFAISSGGGAAASLVDPGFNVRATIGSGQVATVSADAAGRWYVVVESPITSSAPAAVGVAPSLQHTASIAPAIQSTTYLVALVNGGTNPCRPSCA